MKKVATLHTLTPNQRMISAGVPSIEDRLKDVRAWAILTHEAMGRQSDDVIDQRDKTLRYDDQTVAEAVQHVQMQTSESIFWILANVDPDVLNVPAPTDEELEHIGGLSPHAKRRAEKTA